MSNLSIYESSWIEFVFEHRNKSYGAYKLRQESTKNTLTAFFLGVVFISIIVCISTVINKLSPNHIVVPDIPVFEIRPIDLDKIITAKPVEPLKKKALPSNEKPTQTVTTSQQLINPQITNHQESLVDVMQTKDAPLTNSSNLASTTLNSTENTSNNTATTTNEQVPLNSIVNAAVLDQSPEFPGGIKKFYQYVGTNFSKPDIEGLETIRIMIAFVIEKDGSMTDIKIIKDPGYGLGKEAIRVLQSLKIKWSPGVLNGKAVRTAYTLPIVIKSE